jgi:hypothetical protein
MNAHGSRLTGITKDLWAHWQQTKDYWRDDKAHEFERKYMDELMVTVDRSVGIIEQLDKLLIKIRKDCE